MNGDVRVYKCVFVKEWKLVSNKVTRERRSQFLQTCFQKKCGNLVQAKLLENSEVRSYKLACEKCVEIRFKQGYERTLKSVYTNVLLRKMSKLGSTKIVRERRSPFIQTCF